MGYTEKVENPIFLEGEVPFQTPIAGFCSNCGLEIYNEEEVYEVEIGTYIHRDIDEIEEWFQVKKGNLYVGNVFEK